MRVALEETRMHPFSNERRRAYFQKLLRLFLHPVTWKVIVGVGQVIAWLWDYLNPRPFENTPLILGAITIRSSKGLGDFSIIPVRN
jgi:hypothetical protein